MIAGVLSIIAAMICILEGVTATALTTRGWLTGSIGLVPGWAGFSFGLMGGIAALRRDSLVSSIGMFSIMIAGISMCLIETSATGGEVGHAWNVYGIPIAVLSLISLILVFKTRAITK